MYAVIRTIHTHTDPLHAAAHPWSYRKNRGEPAYLLSVALGTFILAALLIFAPHTHSYGQSSSCQKQTAAATSELSFVMKTFPQIKPETAAEVPSYIEYEVPATETGFKTYMGYKAITSTTSTQWAMQQDAWTDELGFRRYGNFYMVAMGTYYGTECGGKFHIKMEYGAEFDVINGDIKADRDTDALHQHRNGNVLEFIVDSKRIPEVCRITGDMSHAGDMFAGKIASIRSYQAQQQNTLHQGGTITCLRGPTLNIALEEIGKRHNTKLQVGNIRYGTTDHQGHTH